MLLGKEQITGKKELGDWAMSPPLHHQAFEQGGLSDLKSTETPTAPAWKKWIFLNAWANQRFGAVY